LEWKVIVGDKVACSKTWGARSGSAPKMRLYVPTMPSK